ncbi:MAG: hypothetical protein ACTH36_11430, partial [Pseudoalteromonas nigrifaciens]
STPLRVDQWVFSEGFDKNINKLLNYQDRITWFLFQKSIIIFNYPYLLSLLTVKARLILSI